MLPRQKTAPPLLPAATPRAPCTADSRCAGQHFCAQSSHASCGQTSAHSFFCSLLLPCIVFRVCGQRPHLSMASTSTCAAEVAPAVPGRLGPRLPLPGPAPCPGSTGSCVEEPVRGCCAVLCCELLLEGPAAADAACTLPALCSSEGGGFRCCGHKTKPRLESASQQQPLPPRAQGLLGRLESPAAHTP